MWGPVSPLHQIRVEHERRLGLFAAIGNMPSPNGPTFHICPDGLQARLEESPLFGSLAPGMSHACTWKFRESQSVNQAGTKEGRVS